MTLRLGLPAHHRSAEQQSETREARRLLKEKIRDDWDWPVLPEFHSPTRIFGSASADQDADADADARIAGFNLHSPLDHHSRTVANSLTSLLNFDPVEWRERERSSDESSADGSIATASSSTSKRSTYKFEGPDSVGAQLSDRKLKRRRKRQRALDEEATWNDGLAHWLARRDAWSGAHTEQQVQLLEASRDAQVGSASASASASSTPRTSTSSSLSVASATTSSPSTTPEPFPESSTINSRLPLPSSEVLIPLAPKILAKHPIRRRITPEIFPEIYTKIILQSRTPSVPINLAMLTRALVEGWKSDGEWPPKVGPVEKSIGKKKSGSQESSLRHSVKAVGRVLRITSGESHVGSNGR